MKLALASKSLTAQIVYDTYVKGVAKQFRPSKKGKQAILQVLSNAMRLIDNATKTKCNKTIDLNSVTYHDICVRPQMDYDGFKGAAFLSVCCLKKHLRMLCQEFPVVLSALVSVAKELGVGNMLKQSTSKNYYRIGKPLSLFLIIIAGFPELACRLLQEPVNSPCFPNLSQTGCPGSYPDFHSSAILEIAASNYEQLFVPAANLLPETNIPDELNRLFVYRAIPTGKVVMINIFLSRLLNNPSILYVSSHCVVNLLEQCTKGDKSNVMNMRKSLVDVCVNHSRYIDNVLLFIHNAVNSFLLYDLCVLIKSYLFVIS
jgi:hypothetical protein